MSKATKADIYELHGLLVQYATEHMLAVVEGEAKVDAKSFAAYLSMVRNDDIKAQETDDVLSDAAIEMARIRDSFSDGRALKG